MDKILISPLIGLIAAGYALANLNGAIIGTLSGAILIAFDRSIR